MKFVILITAVFFLCSCRGNKPVEQVKSIQPIAQVVTQEPRRLRYVMKPVHCGIIGFFNDGTVAGTVDTSVTMYNLASMDTAEVFAHYTIDKHFIVFDDDHNSLDFSDDFKDAYSWLMVDYKWKRVVRE